MKTGHLCENYVVFHFLARQGLPFTVHGDDKDSNFKQLLSVGDEDDLTFTKWFEKIKPTIPLKFKMKC